jgi:hypothetical protein
MTPPLPPDPLDDGTTCRIDPREPIPRLEDLFADYARHKAQEQVLKGADVADHLFIKGDGDRRAVDGDDIVQGQHADCFLIAAMAAVATAHPDGDQWLRNAIHPNADGTFTVTFYAWTAGKDPLHGDLPGFKPLSVTITPDFVGPAQSNDAKETWPAVLEKAYSVAFHDADDPIRASKDAYGFGGGDAGMAMARLTGVFSETLQPQKLSIAELADYRAKGFALTAGSVTDRSGVGDPLNPVNSNPAYQPGGISLGDSSPTPLAGPGHNKYNESLRPWHVYYVSDVNVKEGTVTVHNVWDEKKRDDITMSYGEFQGAFDNVQANSMKAPAPTP